MKVIYDSETNTLDLIFREVPVAESDEVQDGIIIDYGQDGKLVSIEVLDASEHVQEPAVMVYEVKSVRSSTTLYELPID
jgi:uncharacterized protein YuzE